MLVLPAMVMWGANWWQSSLIRKYTLQLVCLELPLFLPKSVSTGHIHLNAKNIIIIIYSFIKHTIIHSHAIKDAVQEIIKHI